MRAPLTFAPLLRRRTSHDAYVLIDRSCESRGGRASNESRGGRASNAPRTVAEPVIGIDGADPRPPSPDRGRETRPGVPRRKFNVGTLGREITYVR